MVWYCRRRSSPTAPRNRRDSAIAVGVSDMLMDPYLVVSATAVSAVNCPSCCSNDVLSGAERRINPNITMKSDNVGARGNCEEGKKANKTGKMKSDYGEALTIIASRFIKVRSHRAERK